MCNNHASSLSRASASWLPAAFDPTIAVSGPRLHGGGLRFFANKPARRGGRGGKGGGRGGPAAEEVAPVPPLSRVMRLFVARVHPDRFGAFPAEQQVNERSLSELTGFLSNVSNAGGGVGKEDFLPAQKIKMEFFVQQQQQQQQGGGDASPQLRKIDFKLRTTGGDCKHLVQRQLVELFEIAGVSNPHFVWDDKFWKTQDALVPQDWSKDEEGEDGEQQAGGKGEEGRRRSTAAAATAPRTLEQILADLDPVLQAIAAVPWLPESDRISSFVRIKAFGDLEAQGWRQLRPAAEVSGVSARLLLLVVIESRSLVLPGLVGRFLPACLPACLACLACLHVGGRVTIECARSAVGPENDSCLFVGGAGDETFFEPDCSALLA